MSSLVLSHHYKSRLSHTAIKNVKFAYCAQDDKCAGLNQYEMNFLKFLLKSPIIILQGIAALELLSLFASLYVNPSINHDINVNSIGGTWVSKVVLLISLGVGKLFFIWNSAICVLSIPAALWRICISDGRIFKLLKWLDVLLWLLTELQLDVSKFATFFAAFCTIFGRPVIFFSSYFYAI